MSKQENEQLANDFVASWNARDAARSVTYLADGGVWTDVSIPEPMHDRAMMQQYVQGWNTAIPDMDARVVRCIATDDEVAVELSFTGTNTGPLQMGPGPAMPPTGKQVVGRGTFFGRVSGGKFTELHTYPDIAGLMMQLGVMSPS